MKLIAMETDYLSLIQKKTINKQPIIYSGLILNY